MMLVRRFYELTARLDRHFVELCTDRSVVDILVRRHEVAQHLANDIIVASLFEVGLDNRFRVRIGFFRRQTHQARRPFADKAIAPRRDAKLHFLFMREFVFKPFFAIFKTGHGTLSENGMLQLWK
jgi:hypothetical protein